MKAEPTGSHLNRAAHAGSFLLGLADMECRIGAIG
jgi:hypothetical protein